MKKIITSIFVFSAVLIARLLPFNIIIGSEGAIFSWSSICAPVIAAQFGFGWLLSFLCTKSLCTTVSLPLLLLHRLPLYVASYAFIKRSKIVSLCVPIICIILFVVHSVGSQSWLYAMYWFIPMVLYFVKDSELSRALTASFVAHAVGSVIWLYTGSISSQVWISLIPIVAYERLLMSGMIILLHRLCIRCVKIYTYVDQRFFNCKVV